MNDIELLRAYARHGTQEAFNDLVRRHLPVVYGAARRQVRSPDLAHEVAQTVFLELARTSPRLRPDTCLVSWLYVATRRKAVDVIRREASRARHEHAAAVMNEKSTPEPWTTLEPLLDEAMDSLNPDDRRAVLLRFFENQSLTQVGGALNCSEDAAQKRVARALERLRTFLARRGVVTVASALAADLTAFAAPPAPAALSVSIATALPATVTATGLGSGWVLALPKVAGVAACVGALGFACYYGWALHRQRTEQHDLQAVAVRWETDASTARTERDRLKARLAQASTTATTAPVSADTEFDGRIRAVLKRVAQAKQRFRDNPALAIPELSLLSDSDWFAVVQEQRAWGTEEDWRESLGHIRTQAKNRATSPMQRALRDYVRENKGQLPTDVAQLAPYLQLPPNLRSPMDPAIFSRYEMVASGAAEKLGPGETVIQERKSAVIDAQYDNLGVLGLDMMGVRAVKFFPGAPNGDELQTALESALKAYRAAHDGKAPANNDLSALTPYFSDPDKAASFLQQANVRMNGGFSHPNAVGYAMNLYHAANHGQYAPTPKDLAPYFQNPADGERYIQAVASKPGW